MKLLGPFPLSVIIVLFSALNCDAQTFGELLKSCEAITNESSALTGEIADIPRAGLPCWYYVSAIQDMSVLEDGEGKRLLGVCSPPNSTTMDFVKIFVRSAKNKKLRTNGDAAALALPGFAQAFPCTADARYFSRRIKP